MLLLVFLFHILSLSAAQTRLILERHSLFSLLFFSFECLQETEKIACLTRLILFLETLFEIVVKKDHISKFFFWLVMCIVISKHKGLSSFAFGTCSVKLTSLSWKVLILHNT